MVNKITINKITIEKLKPTKKKFKNKNGKFSAQGHIQDLKVKIYEVFDQKQGNLREFISNHKELSLYFPKLIAYDSNYIVEEWINGQTLKEANYQNTKMNALSSEVKNIIYLMWSVKYDDLVFDYINYIHKRVNKINNFNLKNLPIRINHNDLSLDNILVTSNGLKIIDNEFLGCNNGWILNIKNSFLKEDLKYQNFVSSDTINLLWDIRREWSHLKLKNSKNMREKLHNIVKKIL